jgi:hypothetical protein
VQRDFWDWVVVVGVPTGTAIAALTMLVAWITLRRARTLITFRDPACEDAPHVENQVDAGVTVTVSTSGMWKQKKFEPTIRLGRRGQRIRELQYSSQEHFPPLRTGPWEGRARWRFARPDAGRIRVKLKIRLWPHGRGTFKGTLDVPPRPPSA